MCDLGPRTRVLVLTAALLLFVASALACSPKGPRYEVLDSFYSDYPEKSPAVFVVAAKESSIPDWTGNQQHWSQVTGSFDFARYIMVFVFHGQQVVWSNMIFKAVPLQATNEAVDIVIAVLVPRDAKSVQSIVSEITCPVDVLKIRKADLRGFGNMTFRLLDAHGQEKASTVAFVPGH